MATMKKSEKELSTLGTFRSVYHAVTRYQLQQLQGLTPLVQDVFQTEEEFELGVELLTFLRSLVYMPPTSAVQTLSLIFETFDLGESIEDMAKRAGITSRAVRYASVRMETSLARFFPRPLKVLLQERDFTTIKLCIKGSSLSDLALRQRLSGAQLVVKKVLPLLETKKEKFSEQALDKWLIDETFYEELNLALEFLGDQLGALRSFSEVLYRFDYLVKKVSEDLVLGNETIDKLLELPLERLVESGGEGDES